MYLKFNVKMKMYSNCQDFSGSALIVIYAIAFNLKIVSEFLHPPFARPRRSPIIART
jgi:hypothetical protein